MSTRATYLFKGSEYRPDVCLYIHHDSYESGAAYYLYNAFNSGGNVSAESMIRGNDKAEITESHDAHGDTEYRYTINGNDLTVKKVYGDTFKTIYTGDWVDFVNQHLDAAWVDDIQVLKRIDIEYRKGIAHTPKTLQAVIDDDCRTCGIWASNGNAKGANFDGITKRIAEMRAMVSNFGDPSWK